MLASAFPAMPRRRWKWGADAVLVNTAIAVADDPVNMAKAFRLAVEAGLLARQSGPGSRSYFGSCHQPADRISGGIGMKTFSDRWRQTGLGRHPPAYQRQNGC
ncbi:thiazole biosynthesis protein [Escherichia coli]|nr:thiazole biosynthesis protein [Escherichia coli]